MAKMFPKQKKIFNKESAKSFQYNLKIFYCNKMLRKININLHITSNNSESCNGLSESSLITILSASQPNVTPFSKRDAVNVNWLTVVNVWSTKFCK